MKRTAASALVAGAILSLLAASLAFAAPGEVTGPDALAGLAEVRQATERYHDVNRALADGYVPASPWVAVPGLGTMGIHYVNFGLVADAAVSAASPEILLYVPTNDGFRLVGVEYLVVDYGQSTPEVLGRPLDGPMSHEGVPFPHYELHAWIWQGNPAGMFAEFNPTLSC